MSKLSEQDRKEIVEMRLSGKSLGEIANIYGVSRQAIAYYAPAITPELQKCINDRTCRHGWTKDEIEYLRQKFVFERRPVSEIVSFGFIKRSEYSCWYKINEIGMHHARNTTPVVLSVGPKLPHVSILTKQPDTTALNSISASQKTSSILGDPPREQSALFQRMNKGIQS